jgi:hypothetical protein
MTREQSTEAETLLRRAIWFRQFGRLCTEPDREVQDAVARKLRDEAKIEAKRAGAGRESASSADPDTPPLHHPKS